MKKIKLNTGVVITQNSDGNIIDLKSPYDAKTPSKMTILRYYVSIIKQIIKN